MEINENSYLLKKTYAKIHFFSKNWFSALWQGKRPLWEAWWILGIAIYLVNYLLYNYPVLFPGITLIYYSLSVWVAIFLQIFFWVVVWRCSTNVDNNIFLYIARFMIFVGILSSIQQFLN